MNLIYSSKRSEVIQILKTKENKGENILISIQDVTLHPAPVFQIEKSFFRTAWSPHISILIPRNLDFPAPKPYRILLH